MEIRVQNFVLQIDFVDRLGFGYEIFEVFKNRRINLVGMEATSNESMMIKCQTAKEHLQSLMNELITIEGAKTVTIKDYLLCEQKEYELLAILNSVSEGIIAVNEGGVITHLNEVACQIFLCTKKEAIGYQIDDFFQINTQILDTLKTGQPYSLKEVRIQRDNRMIHFLTSGLPITNEEGKIIGAVATVNDFRQVEAMVSKVGGKKRITTFDDIVHQSSAMNRIIEAATAVAKGNSTILLRGESGTGKELFARAIHMESNRTQGSFIAINCGALPDSLLESELFGYEEGAFTGASKGGKKGLFEQANGGTLFLDEIGEISPQVQVRLLRVLQENAIRRVGGGKEIPVDVRILAATNRNLEEMIQTGEFREDLYYRLNVFPIWILPLRERRDDIPLIAQFLIRKICVRLDRPEICLTKESLEFLMKQDWPGNIRQLENVLERIINVLGIGEMKLEDFYSWKNVSRLHGVEDKLPIGPEVKFQETFIGQELLRESLTKDSIEKGFESTQRLVSEGQSSKNFLDEHEDLKITVRREYASLEIRSGGAKGKWKGALHVKIPFAARWSPLKTIVNEVEKQILLTVLEKHPSSRKAGKVLGVSGTTILNKMSAYGIALKVEEDDE